MNKFKDILKELRLDRGLTQVDLSNATGTSQGAISAWELGDRTPYMEALIKLAKYFNVSIDYLVGIADE